MYIEEMTSDLVASDYIPVAPTNDEARKYNENLGIPLCETYNLSKGKSLNEFMNEGDNDKVVKLLDDLLEYYEVRYYSEMKSDDKTYNGTTYKSLYNKCKDVIGREK